jgi:hypothetical protein
MVKFTLFVVSVLLATSTAAFAEHRMISIGDRRISVYCDGERGLSPAVILIPGLNLAEIEISAKWKQLAVPKRPNSPRRGSGQG